MSNLYRIDTMSLPVAAREPLLVAVSATHDILRAQPGFVRDMVVERRGEAGRIHLLTLVEWASEAAMHAAGPAVQHHHNATGFDRARFLAQHAIQMEPAIYHPLSATDHIPAQP